MIDSKTVEKQLESGRNFCVSLKLLHELFFISFKYLSFVWPAFQFKGVLTTFPPFIYLN